MASWIPTYCGCGRFRWSEEAGRRLCLSLKHTRNSSAGHDPGEAQEEGDDGPSRSMATQKGVRASSQGMTGYSISFLYPASHCKCH